MNDCAELILSDPEDSYTSNQRRFLSAVQFALPKGYRVYARHSSKNKDADLILEVRLGAETGYLVTGLNKVRALLHVLLSGPFERTWPNTWASSTSL
jgi:hypothetical protein